MHWGFQLLIHGLYQLGGHGAMLAFKVALLLGLCGVLGGISWSGRRAGLSALALAMMLASVRMRLLVRPELISFLLLSIQLALLYRHRRKADRWVFWLIPSQLVWANVHGLFAVGIVVTGMALVAEFLQPRLDRSRPFRRDAARNLAWVLVASMAVSLVNPNGLEAALFPLQQLGMIATGLERGVFGNSISELIPLLETRDPYKTLLLAAGPASAVLLANLRRPEVFDWILLLALGYLALSAERNVPLLALACVPIFVRGAGTLLDLRPGFEWISHGAAAIAIAVLVVTVTSFEKLRWASPSDSAVAALRFPVVAADWLEAEKIPGPLYHTMNDGGYLIWRLYPKKMVMVDGRLEVFGERLYASLMANMGTAKGLVLLEKKYHFGAVLIHYRSDRELRTLRWLHAHPDWVLVQADEVAALFVRQMPGQARAAATRLRCGCTGGTDEQRAPGA